MTATTEHSTATEYADGYAEGTREGAWILHDQRASLYSSIRAELEEHARHASFPYSRAFALGMLRGFRHAAWEVR